MAAIHSVVYHRLQSPLNPLYGDANGLKSSRSTTLIEIKTDDGVTGWGETFSAAVNSDLLQTTAEILAGKDPVACRPLVDAVRAVNHRLAAGVEIALWDIRGKMTGMSIAQLLGGSFGASQPSYASLQNVSEAVDVTAAAVKEAEAAIGLGYTSLKMKIGWHRPKVDLA